MAEVGDDIDENNVSTDETIANRVRLRRRRNDNKTASNSDDAEEGPENATKLNSSVESLSEVLAADEFVGIMATTNNTSSQTDTCVALKRGSLYLCNMCPFEATDVNTVIRHLFAAHVFRCGICKFHCTSRWDLRKHERNLHGSFSGGPTIQRLSLRRDDDYFSLIDAESNHMLSKLSSSSTPRLMNGIGSPVECTKRTETNGTTKHQIDEGVVYSCQRCSYVTLRQNDIIRHCAPLTRFEFLCPGCHFGSPLETVVQAHAESCKQAPKPVGRLRSNSKNVNDFFRTVHNSHIVNLTNGTNYHVNDEKSRRTFRHVTSKKLVSKASPKTFGDASSPLVQILPKENPVVHSTFLSGPKSIITNCSPVLSNEPKQLLHSINTQTHADKKNAIICTPDTAASIKPRAKQATFVLKRSYSDAELFPLSDQMARYSRVTLEKIYGSANDAKLDTPEIPNEKSELVKALKLVDRSAVLLENKRHRLRESLYESDGASHQFVLASGSSPVCPCPSEFSHFVRAKPLPSRTIIMSRPKPTIIREPHKLSDGTQYFLCSKCRVVVDPTQPHCCSSSGPPDFCNDTDVIVID